MPECRLPPGSQVEPTVRLGDEGQEEVPSPSALASPIPSTTPQARKESSVASSCNPRDSASCWEQDLSSQSHLLGSGGHCRGTWVARVWSGLIWPNLCYPSRVRGHAWGPCPTHSWVLGNTLGAHSWALTAPSPSHRPPSLSCHPILAASLILVETCNESFSLPKQVRSRRRGRPGGPGLTAQPHFDLHRDRCDYLFWLRKNKHVCIASA